MPDGEVSPYFHEVAQVGDSVELRGPFGGHFAWTAGDGGPLLLIGGGSGVAPLMSILRHRAARAPEVPATLLYAVRTLGRGDLPRRARRPRPRRAGAQRDLPPVARHAAAAAGLSGGGSTPRRSATG